MLNNAALLSRVIVNAAALSNTKLLETLFHPFPGHGVTALELLAESHIAIHIWPEHGYAAVGCLPVVKALVRRQGAYV